MSFGFRKSFKVAPGLRLTMSKRGASVSGGRRGARMSVNTRGERRVSLGWRGLFWRKRV